MTEILSLEIPDRVSLSLKAVNKVSLLFAPGRNTVSVFQVISLYNSLEKGMTQGCLPFKVCRNGKDWMDI